MDLYKKRKKLKVWNIITLQEGPGLQAKLCKLLRLHFLQWLDVNASHSWRLSACCKIHQELVGWVCLFVCLFSLQWLFLCSKCNSSLKTTSSWPKCSHCLPELGWPISTLLGKHVSGLCWQAGSHICLLLGSAAVASSLNPGHGLESCF